MRDFLGVVILGYLAVGVYRCMTSADGQGYFPANCPTVTGAGLPPLPPECTGAGPRCSNRTIECVLKWPLWNATKCNTHL